METADAADEGLGELRVILSMECSMEWRQVFNGGSAARVFMVDQLRGGRKEIERRKKKGRKKRERRKKERNKRRSRMKELLRI